jgi:hypothetical protein
MTHDGKALSIPQDEFRDLEDMRETIGSDVILLPWPFGVKGTPRKWKHLTIEDMARASYLEELSECVKQRGNIGAALGRCSNHLCSFDPDSDAAAQEFLAENPPLKKTLITKGNDGVNIFVRILGDYPGSKAFNLKRGDDTFHWGSWRSDGNQTIIFGKHPEGPRYRILHRASPIAIEFGSIIFPDWIKEKLHREPRSVSDAVSASLLPSLPLSVQSSQVFPHLPVEGKFTVESIVLTSTPTQKGQNNDRLFRLARGAKTLEKQLGRALRKDELDHLFDRWFVASAQFLNPKGPHGSSRPGEIETDYRIEFIRQYKNAEITLDNDTIAIAWAAALKNPLPSEALRYDGPTRMAVALCRELQRLRGELPIYVPTREGARLLGVDSNRTVSSIFNFLVWEGLLELVERGGRGTANPYRSNRYRYLGKLLSPSEQI